MAEPEKAAETETNAEWIFNLRRLTEIHGGGPHTRTYAIH